MNKTNSFRSKSIWLNVFETEDGKRLATINKSYKKNGKWETTPFFNITTGDLEEIQEVIEKCQGSINEVVK